MSGQEKRKIIDKSYGRGLALELTPHRTYSRPVLSIVSSPPKEAGDRPGQRLLCVQVGEQLSFHFTAGDPGGLDVVSFGTPLELSPWHLP